MIPALESYSRYATFDELRSRRRPESQQWLSPGEREQHSRFRDAGRREAWLFGRLLSKRLILDCFADTISDPRSIQIRSRDARGRAVRPCVLLDGRPQPWCLSISHSDRAVLVALCAAPGFSLGVDLVVCQTYPAGFLKTWFAPEEQAWLKQCGSEEASKLWAIKEAVYKAQNAGESFAPRRICVRRLRCQQYACSYDGVDLADDCDLQIWDVDQQVAVIATVACRS